MRRQGILAVLAVCVFSAGCSEYLLISWQNVVHSPFESLDECRMSSRNHRRAEEAWQLCTQGSTREYSQDYAKGFKAGYADYLTNGGTGDPPAIPPSCYRTVRYQTPEGVEAINQWFDGWKHGALMAKASGMREIEIVPLSAPPINAIERFGPPIALPPLQTALPVPRAMPPIDK